MNSTDALTQTVIRIHNATGRSIDAITAELVAAMMADRPALAYKVAREAGLV